MKKTLIYLLLGMGLFLISCGGKTDKDIFESAKQKVESENYSEALSDFEELVTNYPNSEYYQESLLQTGELYQGHVNKNISYEESLAKAINSYRIFNAKYVNDPKVPQTLFMIGFIQANDLGQFDSAKVTYSKFIELYPDNEMTESARSEIDNLGLTPDEILIKKMKITTE